MRGAVPALSHMLPRPLPSSVQTARTSSVATLHWVPQPTVGSLSLSEWDVSLCVWEISLLTIPFYPWLVILLETSWTATLCGNFHQDKRWFSRLTFEKHRTKIQFWLPVILIDHWGDPDVDGRIILRWIFRKWEGVVWIGWSWLRIGTGGGHLWVRWWTFGFRKMRGISWLAAASQIGLCSME